MQRVLIFILALFAFDATALDLSRKGRSDTAEPLQHEITQTDNRLHAQVEAFAQEYRVFAVALGLMEYCEQAGTVETLRKKLLELWIYEPAPRAALSAVTLEANGVLNGLKLAQLTAAGKREVCAEGNEWVERTRKKRRS